MQEEVRHSVVQLNVRMADTCSLSDFSCSSVGPRRVSPESDSLLGFGTLQLEKSVFLKESPGTVD